MKTVYFKYDEDLFYDDTLTDIEGNEYALVDEQIEYVGYVYVTCNYICKRIKDDVYYAIKYQCSMSSQCTSHYDKVKFVKELDHNVIIASKVKAVPTMRYEEVNHESKV